MPAPPLSNSFEGGTNGTVITVANSGGASGDAFSAIGGTLLNYSNVHSAHGSLSAYSTSVATNQSTNWTGFGSLTSTVYFRMYMWLVAYPTTAPMVMRFDVAAGTRCGGIAINPTGLILARDATNSNIGAAGGVAVATGQWVRIEAAVIPGASANGSIEWRLFNTFDSTTPDEDLTRSGATLGANVDGSRFGFVEGSATTELYWDDVSVSSVGWIGPVVSAQARPYINVTVTA